MTREVVAAQVEAGIELATDGLVRPCDRVAAIVSQISGMRAGEARGGFPGSGERYSVPVAASEVSWSRPIASEDFLFAREGAGRPVKPVLVGPYTLARLADDRAYGDPMALAMGLAAALNQELRALQAAGASFIQIDEPALLQQPGDFPIFTRLWEVLGRGIAATLCLHLEGGDVSPLYPGVTRLKRLGCLSLDCVAGEANWVLLGATPWPDGPLLGLGVVDARDTRVVETEALVARVRSAAGLPPHARILLGTTGGMAGLPRDAAGAKLRALAGAARALSRD